MNSVEIAEFDWLPWQHKGYIFDGSDDGVCHRQQIVASMYCFKTIKWPSDQTLISGCMIISHNLVMHEQMDTGRR